MLFMSECDSIKRNEEKGRKKKSTDHVVVTVLVQFVSVTVLLKLEKTETMLQFFSTGKPGRNLRSQAGA